MMNTDNKTYWVLREDKDFLKAASGKVKAFYDFLDSSKLYDLYSRCLRAYLGGDLSKGAGLFENRALEDENRDSTQLSKLKVNNFRALVKHTIQLTSSERSAFTCRATNNDSKSMSQAYLGDGLIDYYMREKGLEAMRKRNLENGLIAGEGWVELEWNTKAGEEYTADEEGKILYEGDIEASLHMVDDVIRDVYLTDQSQNDWYIVRKRISKFKLAARYPKHAEKILRGKEQEDTKRREDMRLVADAKSTGQTSDLITYFVLYHVDDEVVKGGKHVVFLEDCVLWENQLPYKEIPLYGFWPDRIPNSNFGYSPAFDLLAPQQLLDIVNSTLATSQVRKVGNPVHIPDPDYTIERDGDMVVIKSREAPRAIDLSPTPGDAVGFKQGLIGDMQTISGISETVMGNPPPSLKSGSALALITQQSLQYHSLLQGNYAEHAGKLATAIIDFLKTFARTERVAYLVGIDKRSFIRKFSKDDLQHINRVVVDATNPMSKTVAGRLQIADTLLEKGLIKSPEKYLLVLETGNLNQLSAGETTESLSIKAENEALREGREEVLAMMTDNHGEHIREHKLLLSDPQSRQDPELVQRVTAHIMEHVELSKQLDPALAQLLRIEVPPPPAPPMAGPGGQPMPAPQGEAQLPEQPEAAVDPLSGEPVGPQQ